MRQHTDGGLDDVVQGCHLPGQADASLKDGNTAALVQQPYRERHTNLRVVAARGTGDAPTPENLIQPRLHHGLAIGARDAYHGDVELVTMALRQSLQGYQRVFHQQEVGIDVCVAHGFAPRHHEVAHAAPIQFVNILVSVAPLCDERKEERLLGKTKRATVCQQKADGRRPATIATRSHQHRNLFYRVIHLLSVYYCLQR